MQKSAKEAVIVAEKAKNAKLAEEREKEAEAEAEAEAKEEKAEKLVRSLPGDQSAANFDLEQAQKKVDAEAAAEKEAAAAAAAKSAK